MTKRSGLLSGGNWIVDSVKLIDVFPQQDALANIQSVTLGSGGSPFNILVDLAIMGAKFPLRGAGLIGNDENGKWIREFCANHAIDTASLLTTNDAPTSFTDVMTVKSNGRRTFFHARGANALLGPEHFDFTKETAKIFHYGYLLLLDRMDQPSATHGVVAAEVLERATNAGMKVSIDCVSEDSDRFPRIVKPALKHTDYCIMNEFEAGRVTGRRVKHDDKINMGELRDAMQALLDEGVRERVIVHYPEGACALGRDGKWHEQNSVYHPPGFIKGTAGAGDAFAAGVLLGWHDDLPVETQLRYGVCAAAANLTDETCTGGMMPLAGCLALGTQYGYQT